MGEKQVFQPLTREDTVTVVLYRIGIILSAVFMSGLAFVLATASSSSGTSPVSPAADIFLYGLYASVGMSVFFIHLYIRKFKSFLKNLYYIGLVCFAVLLFMGKGSPAAALLREPSGALFLLPLSGCLGFVTAKEAFCFQLFEGYLLAMIMPIYLLLVSGNILTRLGVSSGLALIAVMLVVFTLRKAFMPLAFDIGDKSAYH
jgi:uncharacterized integral membrane protein